MQPREHQLVGLMLLASEQCLDLRHPTPVSHWSKNCGQLRPCKQSGNSAPHIRYWTKLSQLVNCCKSIHRHCLPEIWTCLFLWFMTHSIWIVLTSQVPCPPAIFPAQNIPLRTVPLYEVFVLQSARDITFELIRNSWNEIGPFCGQRESI